MLLILLLIMKKNVSSAQEFLCHFFNFLHLQVDRSCLSDVEALLVNLETANRALLHPLVVIWVSSFMDTATIV